MKIAVTIFRYLLGFLFTVFGLNGFLHFIPQSLPANPLAVQFLTAVSVSHYMVVVFLTQLIAGLLLLAGIYFVGVEEGATAVFNGMYVHEFVHDARHLLGFPCH